MSQTILTEYQLEQLENWTYDIENLGGEIYHNRKSGVTVVRVKEFPFSNTARFSVSVRSPVETQNHEKLGKYHALRRMFVNKEYVTLPYGITAERFAEFIRWHS